MENLKLTKENITAAATEVFSVFKNPIGLMSFLREALGWVHVSTIKNKALTAGNNDDAHFNLLVFFDKVLVPWMTCKKGKEVEIISSGLEEYFDVFGVEGHERSVGSLNQSFSNDMIGFVPDEEYILTCISALNMWSKLPVFFSRK